VTISASPQAVLAARYGARLFKPLGLAALFLRRLPLNGAQGSGWQSRAPYADGNPT